MDNVPKEVAGCGMLMAAFVGFLIGMCLGAHIVFNAYDNARKWVKE